MFPKIVILWNNSEIVKITLHFFRVWMFLPIANVHKVCNTQNVQKQMKIITIYDMSEEVR